MKTIHWFIAAAVVIIVLVAGVLFFFKPSLVKNFFSSPVAKDSKASEYSAVFLTNNQVYFGKLTNPTSDHPLLTDVYYLRVQKSLAPPDQGDESANVRVEDKKKPVAPPAAQNELILIKLGQELHGPTDQIQLNGEHILFIEQLKGDSKVVSAIKQHKEKQQ